MQHKNNGKWIKNKKKFSCDIESMEKIAFGKYSDMDIFHKI